MKHGVKQFLLTAVLLAAVTAGLLSAFDTRLTVRHYTISSEKLTGTVRMLLITDLHSCEYGDSQSGLIEAIARQNPDVILLGGDICDDLLPHDNVEALLKGIARRYPCYYVTGNHEYWSRDIGTILDLFRSYGVTVLDGSCKALTVKGQRIRLCGITDPDATKYTDSAIDVQEQLNRLRPETQSKDFTILLAHRPELIEAYADCGFDAVLSGHTHGGQWRLPGVVNGLLAPDQGLFPRYAGGIYTVDHTVLVVSRGLAKESTRIPRIFNRPELVTVELTGI